MSRSRIDKKWTADHRRIRGTFQKDTSHKDPRRSTMRVKNHDRRTVDHCVRANACITDRGPGEATMKTKRLRAIKLSAQRNDLHDLTWLPTG